MYSQDFVFTSETPSPTIIDCGANLGKSVEQFVSEHPTARVLAFEADPGIFERELLPMSKDPKYRHVEFSNKAVWKHNDGVLFYPDGLDTGNCFQPARLDLPPQDPIRVPTIRLSEVLQRFERVDFLKIDIEGAETEVIPECQNELDRVDRIFMEYHSFKNVEQCLSKLLEIFESKGFRYQLEEDYNTRENRWIYHDNGNEMDCQVRVFALNHRLISSEKTA